MTVRFMLGVGLVALLLLICATGAAYAVSYARRHKLHRKRQWRRRGKKLRIDDYLIKPGETERGEP